ncbi:MULTISPECIES: AAA family ATPase [Aeromonas]|uniref:AAA family ATPase n=1 Tax=Aeromonas TaxID=642 RepID=UPI00191CF63D|nr:AAA family ATPase [Aeromonas veronii]MBL0467427.1 AAA family ATPase [Aeromonas veronii]
MTDIRKSKSIRDLIIKSEKNDLSSIARLAKYYRQGKFVQQDDEIAEQYTQKLEKIFLSEKMKLKLRDVKIINLRGITNIELKTSNHNNITVLVGNNGTGKTTILDAILKSLNLIRRGIESDNKNFSAGTTIDINDIRKGQGVSTSSIKCTYQLDDSNYYISELNQAITGTDLKSYSDHSELSTLTYIYRVINSRKTDLGLPLVAYYPVERSVTMSRSDAERVIQSTFKNKTWSKYDGYALALSEKNSFELFISWFRYIDDIIGHVGTELNELIQRRASLKNDYEHLKKLIKNKELQSAGDVFTNSINMLKASISSITKQINTIENTSEDKIKYKHTLDFVAKAIYEFLPSISNLRIEKIPEFDLVADKINPNGEKTTISINSLSQGEKTLISLIGDIARRLVLLNPAATSNSNDSPLNGHGIVLIDEIDLHLHPKWQQSVIPKLTNTFPNIQFILTTHSPIVISTVHHDSVKILQDGGIRNSIKGTLGAKASRVMNENFYVDDRYSELDETKKLNQYKDLVYNDKWDSPLAISLRKELENNFTDEDDEINELDLYIEARKWELEVLNEKNK